MPKSRKRSAHAISLKIAQHLEPADKVMLTRSRKHFCGDLPTWIRDTGGDYYVSPRSCWIVIYKGSGEWENAPRDFTAALEVLHMYLIVAGKVHVRLNISGYILGDERECWDRTIRNPKYWAVCTGPVEFPPAEILRRGFQGFRYTEELW